MNKQELIKRIASRIIAQQHHSRLGKNELRKVMLAKINKKKIPKVSEPKERKDSDYKKLSIEDYEKKYPTFKN